MQLVPVPHQAVQAPAGGPDRPVVDRCQSTTTRASTATAPSGPRTTGLRSTSRTSGCSTASRETATRTAPRSEEHTSELQSRFDLVCRLLLEKKKKHAHVTE